MSVCLTPGYGTRPAQASHREGAARPLLPSAREAAKMLGGEIVAGGNIMCPAPGHSRQDRSLSVLLDGSAPGGFLVNPLAGDDEIHCRDYVRQRLGLPAFAPGGRMADRRCGVSFDAARAAPIHGTLGERYLREGRSIRCNLPCTLRFMPPHGEHAPTIMAAFALPMETGPGEMTMEGVKVRATHRTRLSPDGRTRVEKKFLGSPAGLPVQVSPWADDMSGLSLVIAEGVEDALSAHEATGLAAWAGGSAAHMAKLAATVPDWVETVVLIEEGNEAGRSATRTLAADLRGRVKEIIIEGGARG